MTTNCTVDIYAKLLKYLCIFFSRNVQILVLYAFHHQVLAAVMLPQIFILIKIENLISADGHILRCPGSNITEYPLELKTKVRDASTVLHCPDKVVWLPKIPEVPMLHDLSRGLLRNCENFAKGRWQL